LASEATLPPIQLTELKTTAGWVEGQIVTSNVTNASVAEFLGIQFGQAPVGPLRWQPPQRVTPWTGVKKALWWGDVCVQGNGGYNILAPISEDCLYLNVWKPVHKPGPFAAMLWFYGGSWTTGTASVPIYSGRPSEELQSETVIISANYRVGVMGFLGSEKLRASDKSTGNFGLQDQRLAMQWVMDNADALNIDKSKIMIFGESAGAGSVSAHLVMPNSWPYFTRALMESGPIADWTVMNMSIAELRFTEVTTKTGCDTASNPADCMRALNWTQMLAASGGDIPGITTFTGWAPIIDGVELTDYPYNLAQQGKIANVPILLGTNRDEATVLIDLNGDATEDDYIKLLHDYFGAGNVDAILAQYPVSRYFAHDHGSAAFWTGVAVATDQAMACSARRTARWMAQHNPNVFLYQYVHVLEAIKVAEDVANEPLGCCHASEIPMVFSCVDFALWPGEVQLSYDFVHMWANFATYADPTPANAGFHFTWPRYNASSDLVIQLDVGNIQVVQGLKQYDCDFWDKIEPIHP